jgi:hypothetical protein
VGGSERAVDANETEVEKPNLVDVIDGGVSLQKQSGAFWVAMPDGKEEGRIAILQHSKGH